MYTILDLSCRKLFLKIINLGNKLPTFFIVRQGRFIAEKKFFMTPIIRLLYPLTEPK